MKINKKKIVMPAMRRKVTFIKLRFSVVKEEEEMCCIWSLIKKLKLPMYLYNDFSCCYISFMLI